MRFSLAVFGLILTASGIAAAQTSIRVTGQVTDAETGEPIERFLVIPGVMGTNWMGRSLFYASAQEFTAGDYSSEVYVGDELQRNLRFEADGYLPFNSPAIKPDGPDCVLDVQLRRDENISGTVVTTDGKPVAGADVLLGTVSASASHQSGVTEEESRNCPHTTTDDEGRFFFRPTDETYTVLVVNDDGYALMTPAQINGGRPERLQKWGRIEGRLRIGLNPGAHERVYVYVLNLSPRLPGVSFSHEAETDDDGAFVFERLPEGECMVSRRIAIGFGEVSMHGDAISRTVQVIAGESLQVDLGGIGRPVIGRLELPDNHPDERIFVDAALTEQTASPQQPNADPALANRLANATATAPATAPATTRVEPRSRHMFNIEVDGTFRIDDVKAGRYQLHARLSAMPQQQKPRFGPIPLNRLAEAVLDFTVPEMPGGRTDEPLDLGKIAMQPSAPATAPRK
jgi:hypothetical protein